MSDIPFRSLKRFCENIIVKNNCWLWVGSKTKGGYGKFMINYKIFYTHRLSYIIFKGDIPQGYTIDHLCRNPICCNPNHLECVTQKENLLRSPITKASIHSKKTHCPSWHILEGDNLSKSVLRTGKRRCRICYNKWQRNRRAKLNLNTQSKMG